MSHSTKTVHWALVIPTYKREAVLQRCLYFAARQTLQAKEIIVVDASPDWAQTREQVMQTLAVQYPGIDWQYVQAKRASSAAQRNQGIALATADIVFLIDDDSFMYSDCAEEVLRIYVQDTAHQVAGIMPNLEALPPDSQPPSNENAEHLNAHLNLSTQLKLIQVKLRGWAKRLIKDDDIFIPYDLSFPKYTLPETLKEMAVHPVPMIHGARMSYRREILEEVRFEETLARYAVNEDNDVCYRASRLGMLLQALKARICHEQTSGGRLTRLTTTVLWGLNQAVLHRFHSVDIDQFKKRFVKLLWQRLLTQTIKDVLDRRWTLPSTRGIVFVLRHYQEILSKTPDELRAWYPQFQHTLISRDEQDKVKG
ncbi:MAG: glycosyltransferase family 2 protein [Candidatus Parabeggiatoa sp. nov. 3]|nr:MAG: glycosyltransferase family 2 protein [Gammaproteobacteria bacterium]RKZ67652.1 MAG: glycosyltransferase family 2 protein [Gammaproteobacteria bacterium]RKZ88947.1 MAG: glycosyltransferase family 2 protein [Gammaproteobacteria bacterium]